jgi:dihydroorotate dehydrogenase
MADLSVEVTGFTLRNPILTAAGPRARNGDTLLAAARGGAGGLVAKTVSVSAAKVPTPNIVAVRKGRAGSRRGILNAELWSELPVEQWLNKEYGTALSTGLPVIASLGYTLREAVEIPIFAKLSPNVDVVEVAKSVEPYVDGVVAINSLGPCLRIDIETGRPMLGSESGYGWLSGASIKPAAIRCVADIAQAIRKPIIGVGGVSDGEDAIEFIMAGAHAVEVCTAAILEGQTVYGRIASEMDKWLDAHGYYSVEDVRGLGLKHLTEKIVFTNQDVKLVACASRSAPMTP